MTSQTPRVWAPRSLVRAVWVATGESPEWITEHTSALLEQLRHLFGVEHWRTPDEERWEGTDEAQAEIVGRQVSVNDAYEPPQAEPERGYQLWLIGEGPRVYVRVEVTAGAAFLGGPIPMHCLMVRIHELVPGVVTSATADAVCAAVISTWNPSTVKLSDSVTNSLARRGNWKIGIGYRTWISSEVGTVSRVAEGLSSTEMAGGTLISDPDDWSAQRVVEAMTATLAINGLDEIPHQRNW